MARSPLHEAPAELAGRGDFAEQALSALRQVVPAFLGLLVVVGLLEVLGLPGHRIARAAVVVLLAVATSASWALLVAGRRCPAAVLWLCSMGLAAGCLALLRGGVSTDLAVMLLSVPLLAGMLLGPGAAATATAGAVLAASVVTFVAAASSQEGWLGHAVSPSTVLSLGLALAWTLVPLAVHLRALALARLDLEARRRAQTTSNRLAEHYRLLFDSINDAVFLCPLTDGVPGTFTDANSVACRRLGYTREELLTMSPADIDTPDGWAKVPAMIERLQADQHAVWESVHVARDGRRIPVEITTHLLQIDGCATVLAAVRDITERKQAEAALRLDESRLESLFELSQMHPDSVQDIASYAMELAIQLTGSTIGYVAFASEDESVLTMHAWSQAAMLECSVANKPIDYPLETTGLWGEAVRQRRPVVTNDFAADNPWKKGLPEGHVALERHMNVPVFDGEHIVLVAGVGNKPVPYDESDVRQLTLLMSGMWRIVQRKRADDDLHAKTAELDQFFDVAIDLLCIADTAGRFRRVNPQWEKTLGYPTEELVGREFLELVHPDDRASTVAALSQLRDGEAVYQFVNRYRCKDGSYRFIEWRSAPAGSMVIAAARDVTERKQTQEALEQQQAVMDGFFDSVPGLLYVYDDRGTLVRWNRNFELVFGCETAELKGRQMLSFVVEEDRALIARGIEAILSRGFAEGEASVLTRDGTRVPFYLNGRGLTVSGARYVVGVGLNMTERQRIRRELEARLRFEQLVSDLSARLVVASPVAMDGLVDEGLRSLVELLGCDRATIYLRRSGESVGIASHSWATRVEDKVPTGSSSGAYPWLRQQSSRGETVVVSRVEDLPPEAATDRESLRAAGIMSVLTVPIHATEGIQGTFAFSSLHRELTWSDAELSRLRLVGQVIVAALARRQAEASQQELQRQLATAAAEWTATFDAVKSPVILTDRGGLVRRLNAAARTLADRGWSEIVGTCLGDLGDGEPWATATELVRRASEAGVASAEQVNDLQHQRTWSFQVASFGATGDQVIVSMHDITPLMELQASLRQRETMSAMGSLVGGVAHEVRNPLFAISGLLDALEVKIEHSGELGQFLDALRHETDRLTALMRALLEYGRPVSEERVPTPLAPVISEAVQLCRRDAGCKGVQIDVALAWDLPAPRVDRMRIVEVFRNLVENGVQHTPQGGHVAVTASVDGKQQGGVEIAVRDAGPGFRDEDLARVFDPFFSRRAGGTGLGLSIVQRIVTAHGGSVRAQNHPHGGGVVTVYIPL